MDFGNYLGQKLHDFANAVEGGVQTAGNDLSGLVSQGVNDFKNLVSQPQQPSFQQAQSDSYTQPPPQTFQQPQQQQGNLFKSIGQTADYVGGQIGDFAKQQGQNFLQGKNMLGQSEPYNPVNNPFGAVPHMPDLTSGINTGNGLADFALKTVVGIPQSIVNAPYEEQQAQKQTIQDIGSGQILRPTVAASDVARIGLPIATIATLPEGGSVLRSAGEQGLKEALGQGIVQGAKYGTGFGVAGAVAGNRDVTDPGQYALNVGVGAYQGLAGGAGVGGILGGAGYAYRNLPRAVPVDPEVQPVPGSAEKSLTPDIVQKYGSDLQTPEAKQQLQQHLDVAQQAKPQLDNDFQQVAQANNGEFSSRIKTPDTAIQKVILKRSQGRDYGIDDINDSYGGRITIGDSSQLGRVLYGIQQFADRGDFKILSGERVQKDTYNAYHVDIQTPQGARAEIQVMLPQEKAESLVNHGIRAEYGENPPPEVEALKDRNAAIVKSLPGPEAEALSKNIEQQNKIDPDRASEPLELVPPQDYTPGQKSYIQNHPNTFNEDGTPFVPRTIEQLANDYKNANAFVKAMRTMQQPSEILKEFNEKYQPKSQEDVETALRNIFNDRSVEQRLANVTPGQTQRPGQYSNVPEYDPRTPAQKSFDTGEPIVGKEKPDTSTTSTGPVRLHAKTVQDAIANRFALSQNIRQRSLVLLQQLNRALGPKDTELFRNTIEHPENLDENAKMASSPDKFRDVVAKWQAFTDFVHTSARQAGKPLGYVEDYYSHVLDLSNPADQARFDALTKNFKGYMSRDRVFNTIDELRSKGFKLKNATVQQDLEDYTNSAIRGIGSASLRQGLGDVAPSDVVDISTEGGIPRDKDGKAFVQLKIPGLEDTAVSPKLYAMLKNLEPAGKQNIALAAFGKVNSAIKETKLGGGFFHLLNTTLRKTGLAVTAPKDFVHYFPDMARTVLSIADASGKYQEKLNQGYIDDGTLEKASRMGVTTSGLDADVPDESFRGKLRVLNKVNPLALAHEATFQRAIANYKMQAVKLANIDNLTDQQARQLGAQINNMYGGLNYDLLGRNPATQRNLSSLILAPDFNEGLVRLVATALKPTLTGADAVLARRVVIGTSVAVALAAEAWRKTLTGQFSPAIQALSQGQTPTLAQVGQSLQQDVLQEQVPLPWKNNRGENEVASFPSTPIAEIASAFSDPAHFVQARGAAAPAVAAQLYSGTDYFGNPLLNPYKAPPANILGIPGSGKALGDALAVGQANLPIPAVQGIKLGGGQENINDALLNTAGLRVHTDPNDPTVQYFKIRDADFANANLNPDETTAWQSLHPQTSLDGNRVFFDKTLTTQQRATTYLNNPNVLALDNKINQDVAKQTGQPIDPFFNLSKSQQAFVNAIDALPPGEGSPDKTSAYAQPWYQQYQKDLTSYYSQLPKSTLPQAANANLPTQIQVSPQLQQKLTAYDALPTNTGAKTAYLKANPDVNDYLNQSADLVNMRRADVNLPLNVTKYTVNPALTQAQVANIQQTLEPTYNNLPYGQGARSTFLQKNPDLLHYFEQGGDQKFGNVAGTGGGAISGTGAAIANSLVLNGNAVSPLVQNPSALSTSNYGGMSNTLKREAERRLVLSSQAYPARPAKLHNLSTFEEKPAVVGKGKTKPIVVAGSHVKRLKVAGMGKPKITNKNPLAYKSDNAGKPKIVKLRPVYTGSLFARPNPHVNPIA